MSRRGKFGGYALMPAAQITFGQVLRILDGPIAPLSCLSRIAYRPAPMPQRAKSTRLCQSRPAREVLDRTSIAEASPRLSVRGRTPSR